MKTFILLPWENTIIRRDDIESVAMSESPNGNSYIIKLSLFRDYEIVYKTKKFETKEEAEKMFAEVYKQLNEG